MQTTVDLPPDLLSQRQARAREVRQTEDPVIRAALEAYLARAPELREDMLAWQQVGAEAIEKIAPIANEAWGRITTRCR